MNRCRGWNPNGGLGLGLGLLVGKGWVLKPRWGSPCSRHGSCPLCHSSCPSTSLLPLASPIVRSVVCQGFSAIILITTSTAMGLLRGVRSSGDKMKKQQRGTLFIAIVRLAPGSSINLCSVKGTLTDHFCRKKGAGFLPRKEAPTEPSQRLLVFDMMRIPASQNPESIGWLILPQ